MHLCARSILFSLAFACATSAPALAVNVTSHTPGMYQLSVPATQSTIQIFFSSMLQTVPAGAVRVAGTMSGLHTGSVLVQDNLITWTNLSEPFFAGEMVSVNLSRTILEAGGGPLTGGYYFCFTIASGAGSMSWSTRRGFGAADIPYFIHGGDLDNDGEADIAAPNEGTGDVSVFLNQGSGTFSTHAEFDVGTKPSSIFGEDFDNDGDQDLATADIISSTMSVLKNNGDGSFAPATTYSAGVTTRQIHGGDFDGDNLVDLCTTSFASDEIYLWINQGGGNYGLGIPFNQVSDGPFAIRTGDLNRDGHLDIAVACQNADSLTVLQNNGVGVFTRVGTYRIADLPWCLNGNDFDGDGDMDLVSVASFANRIVVLINNGTGAFPTRNLSTTGSFPLGVYCADLDGDGDIDATSSNYSGGTVGVYRNGGTGLLTLQATLPCELSGSYAWAHDLDGDSDLDLSVVDEEADSLFVFYNGAAPSAIPVADGPRIWNGIRLEPNPVRSASTVTADLASLREALDGRAGGMVNVELVGVDGRRLRSLWQGAAMDLPRELRLDLDLSPGRYFVVARAGDRYASAGVTVID